MNMMTNLPVVMVPMDASEMQNVPNMQNIQNVQNMQLVPSFQNICVPGLQPGQHVQPAQSFQTASKPGQQMMVMMPMQQLPHMQHQLVPQQHLQLPAPVQLQPQLQAVAPAADGAWPASDCQQAQNVLQSLMQFGDVPAQGDLAAAGSVSDEVDESKGFGGETKKREHNLQGPQGPRGKQNERKISKSRDVYRPKNPGKPLVMRASTTTLFQTLAGAVAKRVRREGCLELEAMGPVAVAQVLRALTLARSFLDADLTSFTASVYFTTDRGATAEEDGAWVNAPLRLPVYRQDSVRDVSAGKRLFIDSGALVGKTAGSIAKNVRAAGVGPVLDLQCGPSPTAINTAVKALALARLMLTRDRLCIKIQPVHAKGTRPKPEFEPLTFAVIAHETETE